MKTRLTFCLVVAIVTTLPAHPAADIARKPNVLFIAVDDLNHWVAQLGRNKQVITPNIDRLAKMAKHFPKVDAGAGPRRTSARGNRNR